jgi:hypothetical protein
MEDSLQLANIYSIEIIQQYAQQNMDKYEKNQDNQKTTIYKGLTISQILNKIPILQQFINTKQEKYNRRREPIDLQRAKNNQIASKNLKQYVCKTYLF